MKSGHELLYFDSQGITPYPRETEAKFRARAALLIALHINPRFSTTFAEQILTSAKVPHGGIWNSNFTSRDKYFMKFQRELQLFRQRVGADFSWFPVFGFRYKNTDLAKPQDAAITDFATLSEHFPYRKLLILANPFPYHYPFIPYFAINTDRLSPRDRNLSGCHEAFHAMRYSFDPARDERTIAAKFSHFAGEQMFRLNSNSLTTVESHYQIFITLLRYFFEQQAYYVLARLSYAEMSKLFIEQVATRRSPIEWLKF